MTNENMPVNPFISFSKMNPRILLFSATFLAQMINTSATGEFVILEVDKR